MSNEEGCYLCHVAKGQKKKLKGGAVRTQLSDVLARIASGTFNFGARDPQLCSHHLAKIEEFKS